MQSKVTAVELCFIGNVPQGPPLCVSSALKKKDFKHKYSTSKEPLHSECQLSGSSNYSEKDSLCEMEEELCREGRFG